VSEAWFILGAGALGSALAAWMHERHIAAVLLGRGEPGTRRVCEEGVEVSVPSRTLAQVSRGSIRRLIVTTKAGQLEEAVTGALPYLAPDAVALTTANGLGFPRDFPRAEKPLRLHRAVTTAAAFRDEAGIVHVAARGITRVGTGDASHPATWFSDSLAQLPGWGWEVDIDDAVAEKFAVNCVINPLTALHRCRNGELLDDGRAGPELAALAEETEQALRALGLWGGPEALVDVAAAICAKTASNRSSMLQDVLARRATELPFLTGELLRRCARERIEVPLNTALHARLEASLAL
jgi:2-dehydropantoate 2-reductase